MKKVNLVLLAAASLGGCAIVPAYDYPGTYGPPGVYAVVPAPAIVVRPYYGYRGHYRHGRGGRGGRNRH